MNFPFPAVIDNSEGKFLRKRNKYENPIENWTE